MPTRIWTCFICACPILPAKTARVSSAGHPTPAHGALCCWAKAPASSRYYVSAPSLAPRHTELPSPRRPQAQVWTDHRVDAWRERGERFAVAVWTIKQLTAFFDYPAEHWRHLRTTNPIESAFATVRLRTRVTKGAGSKTAALAMAYKLLATAQERWRRFNGHHLVADVLDGVKFNDGIKVTDDNNHDDEVTDERVAA